MEWIKIQDRKPKCKERVLFLRAYLLDGMKNEDGSQKYHNWLSIGYYYCDDNKYKMENDIRPEDDVIAWIELDELVKNIELARILNMDNNKRI
jgi:hypothetical protein